MAPGPQREGFLLRPQAHDLTTAAPMPVLIAIPTLGRTAAGSTGELLERGPVVPVMSAATVMAAMLI
jgi:hypothetical protein